MWGKLSLSKFFSRYKYIVGILLVASIAYGATILPDLTIQNDLTVTGDINVSGSSTVDGRNVSADGSALDNLTTTLGLSNLTADEVTQLTNIDSVTISNTQWGYLGASDQGFSTTDTPTYDGVLLGNAIDQLQISTPSNPSAGRNKLYFKSDGNLYKLDSAGTEEEVGTGGGGEGGINYITNPDFDTDTTGWNTYADSASDTPDDGTGGSPASVTISQETGANVLRGLGSLSIAKAAADAQGEGTSTDFTIDPQDKNGKKINVSVDYSAIDSNYASGDLRLFIYDVDNAALVGAVQNDDDGDLLATATTFTGQFQTTDSVNYRLIYHVTSTNATAWTVYIDRVTVGPDVLVPGAIVTSWENYTPTGTWVANTTYTGKKRRIGDSLQVQIQAALTGAPISAEFRADVPTECTIDSTKVESLTSSNVGSVSGFDSGTTNYSAVAVVRSSTQVGVHSSPSAFWTQSVPITWASGDSITMMFTVPCEEFSAGANLSTQEANLQTIHLNILRGGANGTLAASFNDVDLDGTVDQDTHSIYDTSTGDITIPRTGWYNANAGLELTHTAATGRTVAIRIYNTTQSKQHCVDAQLEEGSNNTDYPNIACSFYAEKDDVINVQSWTNGSSPTLTNSFTGSYLTIDSEPDFNTFSVFGESKSLAATSSVKSGVTDNTYLMMTGNSVELTSGSWMLNGFVEWSNGGVTPNYNGTWFSQWSDANGADTGVDPGATTVDAGHPITISILPSAAVAQGGTVVNTVRKTVTDTTTVYLVPFLDATSPTNARVTTYIYAERIK